MRKFAVLAVTAVALTGSIGVTAGSAAAVSAPGTGPVEAAPYAAPGAQAADCVKVVKWSTERSSRYVTVKNSCARTACFSVSVPLRKDPNFSIAKNKQQKFRYGGALWSKGTGIKNKAC